MSPSLLIVNPDAFSTGWRAATPRTMDIAEGLTRYGWNVSMLTKRLSYSTDHSALEASFQGRIIRTPFSGTYIPWMDTSDFLRRANRGLWKLKGKAYYERTFQFGWAARTAQWAKRAWRSNLPDVIWTISSSNLSGAIAGRYLSQIFSRPYVMELRDPPVYPGDDAPCPGFMCRFNRSLCHSSAVVTTTESYAAHLRKENGLNEEQVVPIYRSYRGELAKPLAKKNGDELILLHAGSLTTSRGENARVLFESLALVFKNNPSCRGRIRLRLIGGGRGTEEFKQLAAKMNLSTALECVDEMPFEQVKKEMEAADVLLVIKYLEDKYKMQIPGKLFESLGTGKPILGVMRRSTEAAKILNHSGLGIVPEQMDVATFSRIIIELWNNRDRLNEVYQAKEDYVKQFSPEIMAQRVDELLRNVVTKSRTD